MLIGCCDPGYFSGFAMYETMTGRFDAWEAPTSRDVQELRLCNIIVVESFTITESTGHKTQQHDALETIGTLRTMCNERNIDLVEQTPSMKKFGKAHGWRNLKAVGWYKKTKDDHAADAAAHLLNFCLKRKLLCAEEERALRKVLKGK